MADEQDDQNWDIKFRADEEMDFFTELALHEAERWIQAITRKKFQYPDDFRKSLGNGTLLCELLNCLKPGTVKRINKTPGAIAGLDNINVFLNACGKTFGLSKTQLFDPTDLEDLSQRAIADESEEFLKQEVDRRARNVAITIYWLGRQVERFHKGPTIDASAFSALVHHHGSSKNIISNECFSPDTWQVTQTSKPDTRDIKTNHRHNRDSSYDSLGSYERESESSLDDLDENNMPVRSDMRNEMRRAGSTSSLTRSGELRVSASDSVYSDDKRDSMYQSSPDLSQGSHGRTSSTDSMDGSYYGNHSRQSSGSTDYATRLANPRRVSASSQDPLQFVKIKRNDDLARQAEKQIEAVAEVNKMRVSVESNEEPDWQSNFKNWKTKRRQSSHMFERLGPDDEDLGDSSPATKEPEERKVKTYSQMMAEKEKRKSTGTLNFYPIDDDDFGKPRSRVKSSDEDNSWIKKSEAKLTATSPTAAKKSPPQRHDYVAPWAQDASGDAPLDSDTNNHQDFGDTDNVFKEQAVTRVVHDDKSWKRDRTSPKAPESNRYSAPVTVDKPLAARTQKLWESRTEDGHVNRVDRAKGSPTQAGSANKVSGLLKAYETKEKDAASSSASSKRTEFSGRSSKSLDYNKTGMTLPARSLELSSDPVTRRRSFDVSRGKSYSPSSMSPSDKTSPKQISPLMSPTSPKALLPKDQRFAKTSPRNSFTFTSPSAVSTPSKTPPATKNYVERVIKISQKPNNSKGFGFSVTGGSDKRQPIMVDRVSLGSSADVCEVQAKDEILSINKHDSATLTHAQAHALIEGSVKRGQIELKVRRAINEDSPDSMDEDETTFPSEPSPYGKTDAQSSSSSFSTEPSSEDTSSKPTTHVPDVVRTEREDSAGPGIMDQLLAEKKRESNNNDFKLNTQAKVSRRPPSPEAAAIEPQVAVKQEMSFSLQMAPPSQKEEPTMSRDLKGPADEMVTEERQTLSFRRRSPAPTEQEERRSPTPVKVDLGLKRRESPPPAQFSSPDLSSAPENKANNSSDSDFGPPAALRRWQRPRPKSDYNFSMSLDQPTPAATKRLSATLPWRSEDRTPLDKDYSKDDTVLSKTARDFEETVSTHKPVQSPRNTYQFEDSGKLEDWNKKQDTERKPEVYREKPSTPPPVEVFIQKAQQLTPQFAPPESDSSLTVDVSLPISDAAPLSPQEKFEREQQRIRLQYEEEKRQAREAAKRQEEEERKLLLKDADRLQQMEDQIVRSSQEMSRSSPGLPEYAAPRINNPPQFVSEPMTIRLSSAAPSRHLIIDPRNQGKQSESALPEYSFQVDLTKQDSPTSADNTEKELSKREMLEREREKIREEEKRKFEEERRRWKEEQEAEYQRKQEDLRLERERLQQEQERVEREKAMLESQKRVTDEAISMSRYQPVSSSNLYSSPRSSLGSSGSSLSHSPRSPPPALDPKARENSYKRSGPPTAPKPDPREKNRLTREDLLAMNRKATPLQSRPEGADIVTAQDQEHISREPPSKGELHSLNAVPKQKFRSSAAWIKDEEPESSERPFVIGKRSDIIHKDYSNPQDHWVVREAEKRRLAEQSQLSNGRKFEPHTVQTAYTGPIKPFSSSSVNKWKSNSDEPSNRYSFPSSGNSSGVTLNASPRPFSSGTSQYDDALDRDKNVTQFSARTHQPSSQQLTQTLPENFSFSANSGRKAELPVAPGNPARSPDSHAEVMAVSGKQLCSHCGEELAGLKFSKV